MSDHADENAARRAWMATLARTPAPDLQELVERHGETPAYSFPRRPEIGLCQVRGRVGGTGQRFNLGEMTVTRCVVQLADRTTGVAYLTGRDPRRAELAALADALLQNGTLSPEALASLEAAIEEQRRARADAVAATKVDFFTLVRGED